MRYVNANFCLFLTFTHVRYLLGIDMDTSFCHANPNQELGKFAITEGIGYETGPQDYQDDTQR